MLPEGGRLVALGFLFEFLESRREWINGSLPEERTDFTH
jgi:hypothetical protein